MAPVALELEFKFLFCLLSSFIGKYHVNGPYDFAKGVPKGYSNWSTLSGAKLLCIIKRNAAFLKNGVTSPGGSYNDIWKDYCTLFSVFTSAL